MLAFTCKVKYIWR